MKESESNESMFRRKIEKSSSPIAGFKLRRKEYFVTNSGEHSHASTDLARYLGLMWTNVTF